MQEVHFSVSEERGAYRGSYVIEQGVPLLPMAPADVEKLGVFDSKGNPVAAGVELEACDEKGMARWARVTMALELGAGEKADFVLKEGAAKSVGKTLEVKEGEGSFTVKTPDYTAIFTNPGKVLLTTDNGAVLDGDLDIKLHYDARSTVGNLHPVYFEPIRYRMLEQSAKRARIALDGWYRCRKPKQQEIDDRMGYDVEVELTLYADSPVIRVKWRITNHMRFNCSYMWLSRYVFSVPLAGVNGISGDDVKDENKYASWASVRTPGGEIAFTNNFHEWLGKGAGVAVEDNRLMMGGINPPVDGGFGGKSPDIWRKFFYGMSRTFEGSLILNPSPASIAAELKPIPLLVDPNHYSATGELPEGGTPVSFGPYKDVTDRTAKWLLDNQWKGTLWWGEWWREKDVDNNQGIEEVNSGNSPLAPLYHFYRTGDWRYWESAKMSYYYTFDMQFCKRKDGDGPYMHTRRFLLDHQEWFHPRYQRIGGVMKNSHLFSGTQEREKMIWLMRFWGERYIDDDGAPKLPDRDGKWYRCEERAMSIIIESFVLAYVESKDEFFLEIAKRMGGWLLNSFRSDNWEVIAENTNSTRYIQQGLLALYKVTKDDEIRDLFIRLARWTNANHHFKQSTHFIAFHFNYSTNAYKMSGDPQILKDIYNHAKWVLSFESKEQPGTYPEPVGHQIPPTHWMSSYDNTAITSYLPFVTAVMEEAGMKFD